MAKINSFFLIKFCTLRFEDFSEISRGFQFLFFSGKESNEFRNIPTTCSFRRKCISHFLWLNNRCCETSNRIKVYIFYKKRVTLGDFRLVG